MTSKIEAYMNDISSKTYKEIIHNKTVKNDVIPNLATWVMINAGLDADMVIMISTVKELDNISEETRITLNQFSPQMRCCPHGIKYVADLIEPGLANNMTISDIPIKFGFMDASLKDEILSCKEYCCQLENMIQTLQKKLQSKLT